MKSKSSKFNATIKLIAVCALITGATGQFSIANAQTKLKWAHVYETSEPYHKWSVWAGEEFKKAHQRQI